MASFKKVLELNKGSDPCSAVEIGERERDVLLHYRIFQQLKLV